jgi:hypothetical protein
MRKHAEHDGWVVSQQGSPPTVEVLLGLLPPALPLALQVRDLLLRARRGRRLCPSAAGKLERADALPRPPPVVGGYGGAVDRWRLWSLRRRRRRERCRCRLSTSRMALSSSVACCCFSAWVIRRCAEPARGEPARVGRIRTSGSTVNAKLNAASPAV